LNCHVTIATLREFRACGREFPKRGFDLAAESDNQRKNESLAQPPATTAAERALAEAAARRAAQKPSERPREISGREGPEPTRYGDWEVRGLASDF
jgi:hypothetical protein